MRKGRFCTICKNSIALQRVQAELKRRSIIGAQYSSTDIFASKLISEDCGGFYGKKKWHSNSKYSRFIYLCNKKFHKHKERCQTPNLTEDDIKSMFIKAYNEVMLDKDKLVVDNKEVIDLLTNTTKLDNEIITINEELIVITGLVDKLVRENSKTRLKIDEFDKKYDELSQRYDQTKAKHDNLIKIREHKKGQAVKMNSFLTNLIESDDNLDYWDDRVWMLMIESAVVHRNGGITFKFYNGSEVRVDAENYVNHS